MWKLISVSWIKDFETQPSACDSISHKSISEALIQLKIRAKKYLFDLSDLNSTKKTFHNLLNEQERKAKQKENSGNC